MRQALVNNHINHYTNIINFIKENTEQYDILIEDLPSSEDHVNFPNKVTFEPNRNYLDVGAREKQNTKNRFSKNYNPKTQLLDGLLNLGFSP